MGTCGIYIKHYFRYCVSYSLKSYLTGQPVKLILSSNKKIKFKVKVKKYYLIKKCPPWLIALTIVLYNKMRQSGEAIGFLVYWKLRRTSRASTNRNRFMHYICSLILVDDVPALPSCQYKNLYKKTYCYCYYIRFTGELPYPQLSLNSSSPFNLTLGTHGMNAPNTCWIVLVAGSALHDLHSVITMVDSLGQDMLKIPYAIFLLDDNTDMRLDSHRHAMSPAVVSIQLPAHHM